MVSQFAQSLAVPSFYKYCVHVSIMSTDHTAIHDSGGFWARSRGCLLIHVGCYCIL